MSTEYGTLESLGRMYARICAISDPLTQAIRTAKSIRQRALDLEEQALISGAMRRDIEVVVRFVRVGRVTELTPVLK